MSGVVACSFFAFAFLLLPDGSVGGTPSCPATAPPSLSLATTTTCGQSTAVSTRRTWLHWVWNGFLGPVMRSLVLGRQNDLIYNGSPATITEAPFMAYIRMTYSDGSSASCSASIISEQWILTAAHCVLDDNNNPASSVTVSFGSADKTTGQTTTSTTIKYDTAFNTKNLENGHDIALVRLPTPLVFSPSIQPICFPTTDAVLGTTISACDQKAYGWGFIDSAGTIRTNFLQKLDVTVSSKVIPCSRRTDETIICVKGDRSKSGICNGDSGGPLAVRYNDRAYVTGIASFVIKNCASGIAGYTRTSKYATWIQQQISG